MPNHFQMTEEIRNKGYQFKQFNVTISVPVTCSLRHGILYAKFDSEFSELSKILPEFVTPVKEVWKYIITQFIRQEFPGSSESDGSPFILTVWSSHADINSECAALFSNNPKVSISPHNLFA